MLYVKQKEYVKNRYYSYEKIEHVLFSIVQGLSLFFIVFGFLGNLWTKLELQIPEDIQYYENQHNVVCYSKQLMESIATGCRIVLEFQDFGKWIALYCFLVTVLFSVFLTRKKKGIVIVASTIFVIVVSFIHREEIFRGGKYIVENFLKLYNIYFGTKLTCGTVSYIDVVWVGEAFLCLGAILVLLCGIDIFFFQSTKCSLVLTALQCVAIFIVGQVPDTKYTCMMVLGIVLIWFLGKKKEPLTICEKTGKVIFEQSYNEKIGIQNAFYIVVFALLLFFLITKTILMPSFIWFENHRELSNIISDIGNLDPEDLVSKVQDVMNSITKEKPGEAGMGMSGGTLGGTESIKGNGETDLIVTVYGDYSGYVYLKGYAASVYTGDAWKQLPSRLSTDEEVLSSTAMLRTMVKNILGDKGSATHVTVERVRADAKYSYIPYFSEIDVNEKQYYLNGWIKGDGEAIKQYMAYPLISPNQILQLLERIETSWKSEELSYRAIQEIYSECTKYPEELESIKEDFMKYISEIYYPATDRDGVELEGERESHDMMIKHEIQISFTDLTDFVKSYLAQKATYSLSPGTTPQNRDFVEYFLTEQKKGYCVHFATSAVMLYRMLGYPTRYVEGYLAKVNSSNPTNVKNNTAHAWVEVYLEGLGWIPIEVTPGYTSQNIPNNNGDETNERQTEGSIEETPEETLNGEIGEGSQQNPEHVGTEDDNFGGVNMGGPFDSTNEGNGIINIGKPNQSGGNSGGAISLRKVFTGFLKKVLPVFLMISVLWLAILIRSYILLSERRRRISTGNNRQIVLRLYQFTCRLAHKRGIYLDVERTAEEMQMKLTSHTVEEIEQWKRIVQKSYFYPEPISKEERQMVMKVYGAVYDRIKEEKIGSILLKFVYCYPEPLRKKKRKNRITENHVKQENV